MTAATGEIAGPEILPMGEEALQRAIAALTAGDPVAIPTETVYGLAGRADSDDAVAAIYRAKGRPGFNPLIVHVPDVAKAETIAVLDDRARALAERFWPGPLTMVLPRRDGARVADAVTAGLDTVAVRCPAHPVMRAVLNACDFTLAAPSANASGGVSPTTASHVAASLRGRIGLAIDGGATRQGIESTIVALDPDGWRLLRPGPVTAAMIADVLHQPASAPRGGIEAPGQMTSHYAPGKPVRLNALVADEDEFLIGFADIVGDVSLSPQGDLIEAAARLYSCLHIAAQSGQPRIAVAPLPDDEIGAAINDRLRRAAA